jgi:hypothetical protein
MGNKSESKKASKSNTSSEEKKNGALSNVPASEFKADKFFLSNIEKKFCNDSQYNAFPRYNFGEDDSSGRCIVVTEPIVMEKGGLPKINEKFRPTEKDCQYFWLPLLDEDVGGTEFLTKVLEPLDEYIDLRINKNENDNFVKLMDDKKKVTNVKKLKYNSCIKEFTPESTNEDEESDDEDNANSYKRLKVKLALQRDEDYSSEKEQEIKTKVFLCDENGDVREKPEDIKNMAQLREVFKWRCTAQFCIEFNKLWAMKSTDESKHRKCGLGAKCIQMLITKIPEQSGSASVLGAGVFGKKVNVSSSKKSEEKTKEKPEDSESSDDSSDSDSDSSDSEDEKPENNKSDSESGSDSEEEVTPPPKKEKKSSKKVVEVVEESSDSDSSDSEEEEVKPVKKSKKSKK